MIYIKTKDAQKYLLFLNVLYKNRTVRAGFEPAWVAPNGFQDRRVMTASLPHLVVTFYNELNYIELHYLCQCKS